MRWIFVSDPSGLPADAESWLRRDPIRNTVPLTVLHQIAHHNLWRDNLLLGSLVDDGRVRGVVVHTPPHHLVLGDIPPESVPALASALAGRDLPGVNGPLPLVEAFTRSYGRAVASRMAMRLYGLRAPAEPGAEGSPRRAGPGDLDLVTRWFAAFLAESLPGEAGDPAGQARVRVGLGEVTLWEAGGGPVAMAAASTPVAGMSRVGHVYTPPEFRRRGYGAAVTHAVTLAALAAGAEDVVLFTDLANPTSNSIYQAIGYAPVADYATDAYAPR
ncbi:GNAT family N-acetyltransferase [Bailinhaonella thermotolerans]|uniref:GNAT family N-acetyltransferase n=1 Tax=Bailinhaonella thermotolerans TaxID=1070861 RepID=A0A3A4BG81_9ACTN|nr:GNAT family N-acetyltransferase [Bailinhaonella thermotolerans]RJL30322.1 GNAT family N-acetyltransferase [Bailinhaonella thermotolerans]